MFFFLRTFVLNIILGVLVNLPTFPSKTRAYCSIILVRTSGSGSPETAIYILYTMCYGFTHLLQHLHMLLYSFLHSPMDARCPRYIHGMHVSTDDRLIILDTCSINLPQVNSSQLIVPAEPLATWYRRREAPSTTWGTSHSGWPQKGLIGNSPFNKKA